MGTLPALVSSQLWQKDGLWIFAEFRNSWFLKFYFLAASKHKRFFSPRILGNNSVASQSRLWWMVPGLKQGFTSGTGDISGGNSSLAEDWPAHWKAFSSILAFRGHWHLHLWQPKCLQTLQGVRMGRTTPGRSPVSKHQLNFTFYYAKSLCCSRQC